MPKIVDHKKRRVEILHASFDAFAQYGYAALSMRQLANSIGVTTGMLYHYFPSKNDLFESLFLRLQEDDLRAAAQAFLRTSTASERASALSQYLREREERLTKAIQIAVEYHRVQTQSHSQLFLNQTIAGYRTALKINLNLTSDTAAELLLSVIFGMFIQGALAPKISHFENQLPILENIVLMHLMTKS